MVKTSMVVAGIDTGKQWLDAALAGGGERCRVANEEAGQERLCAWLQRHGVERVGIEASGGYDKAVTRRLRAAGLCVAVLQPAQVRASAVLHRRRAKNDRLDAQLIAACVADIEQPQPPPDPRFEALAERLTLIEQIEEDLVRARTRREGFRLPRQQAWAALEIKRLKALRRAEIEALAQDLAPHQDLTRRLELLQSIPGLGLRTALALLIRLPELGSLSREQAAALAGLAPYDDDSGQHHGPRHIAGGRHRLRKSLYAAAMASAFRWNDALKAFYLRLNAKGKPHKLVIVACARKLLCYANTVLARGTPWLTSQTSR